MWLHLIFFFCVITNDMFLNLQTQDNLVWKKKDEINKLRSYTYKENRKIFIHEWVNECVYCLKILSLWSLCLSAKFMKWNIDNNMSRFRVWTHSRNEGFFPGKARQSNEKFEGDSWKF